MSAFSFAELSPACLQAGTAELQHWFTLLRVLVEQLTEDWTEEE
jgi:hypothetical protein